MDLWRRVGGGGRESCGRAVIFIISYGKISEYIGREGRHPLSYPIHPHILKMSGTFHFLLLPPFISAIFLIAGCKAHHRRIVDSSCDWWSKSAECTTSTTSTTTTTSSGGDSTIPAVLLAIGIRNRAAHHGESSSDGSGGSSEEGCTPSDCNSNGFCFGLRSEPVCLCRRGYCGPNCKSTDCSGELGCNGRGWSVSKSATARCVCRPGWKGKYCQTKD